MRNNEISVHFIHAIKTKGYDVIDALLNEIPSQKGINFTPTILLWDDCSACNCSLVLVNTLIL